MVSSYSYQLLVLVPGNICVTLVWGGELEIVLLTCINILYGQQAWASHGLGLRLLTCPVTRRRTHSGANWAWRCVQYSPQTSCPALPLPWRTEQLAALSPPDPAVSAPSPGELRPAPSRASHSSDAAAAAEQERDQRNSGHPGEGAAWSALGTACAIWMSLGWRGTYSPRGWQHWFAATSHSRFTRAPRRPSAVYPITGARATNHLLESTFISP